MPRIGSASPSLSAVASIITEPRLKSMPLSSETAEKSSALFAADKSITPFSTSVPAETPLEKVEPSANANVEFSATVSVPAFTKFPENSASPETVAFP